MRRLLDRLRLSPNPRGPSRKLLTTFGLLAIGSIAFLLYLGVSAQNGIPGTSYYYVSAVFPQADNLRPHNRVRIGAVDVGQILTTRIDRGRAVVEMQLKGDLAPLRKDTRARIRPESAIGTRFLELQPGTKGGPLADGGVIPAEQTRTQVTLDRVFDTLDKRRRARAHALLNELGRGFFRRGEDVNVVLGDLPTTLFDVRRIGQAVNERGGLGPFVRAAQGAANAADPVREDIARGFDPQQRTLRPFVDHADDVQNTLEEAPPTLRAATRELPRTAPLLRNLEAFSRAAVPALRVGRGTLNETSALLTEARPGLRVLPATLSKIRPATPATLRLLRVVEPVLPGVDTALESAQPLVDELAPRRCDMQRWVRNWSSALSWGDEFSSYLRFNLQFDQTSIPGQKGTRRGVFASPYPAPCEIDRQKVTR